MYMYECTVYTGPVLWCLVPKSANCLCAQMQTAARLFVDHLHCRLRKITLSMSCTVAPPVMRYDCAFFPNACNI